jgi:hypothetical protein
MPIRNQSPERAQCRTYDLPEYHLDAYIASPGFAPSGLADLDLIPNPGRCPGLSPVTPLGLKTTSKVAVRLRTDVAKRRQTVGVFLAIPTAWQQVASAPSKASKQKGASPFMGLIWTH